MAATYLNLIFVYLSLLLFCSRQALGFAVPIDSQSPASISLSLPNLDLGKTHSNLRTKPNFGDMVDKLLQWLVAQRDIKYRQALLIGVIIRINNRDAVTQPTLSGNVGDFRFCSCVFRYGGPPYEQMRNGFSVANGYPQHWDRWGALVPVRHVPDWSPGLRIIQWQQAWARMSLERADELLKANGYRDNRYGQVALVDLGARPLGWCFDYLELAEGELVAVNVEIRTGHVVRVGGATACASLY